VHVQWENAVAAEAMWEYVSDMKENWAQIHVLKIRVSWCFLHIFFEFRKWSFNVKPNDTLTTSVFNQFQVVKSIIYKQISVSFSLRTNLICVSFQSYFVISTIEEIVTILCSFLLLSNNSHF
jgi:hypothetical protein